MKLLLILFLIPFAHAKFSLEKELQKEMPLPAVYEVKTPFGNLNIPSADKKVVSQSLGEVQQVVSNIGPVGPFQCFISGTTFSGATIHALKNALFTGKKDLQLLGIHSVKTGRGKRSPYTSINYLYKVVSKNTIGLVKIYIANVYDHNIRCLHDQLGYSGLTEQAFLTVLNSFVPKVGNYDHLKSNEIFRIQIQGAHLGHSQVRKFDLGNGKKVYHTHLLMMLKKPKIGVVFNDSWIIQEVNKDEKVVKSFYTTKENGVILNNIVLQNTKGNDYKVNGLFQRKKVQGNVSFKEPFFSDKKMKEMLTKVIKNKEDLEVEAYDASIDPLKVLKAKYSFMETNEKRSKIKLSLDDMNFHIYFKNKEYVGMDFVNKIFPAQFIKLK